MTTKIRPDNRLIIDSTNGVQLPRGTTGQRPNAPGVLSGTIRFNITSDELEVKKSTGWETVTSGAGSAYDPATILSGNLGSVTSDGFTDAFGSEITLINLDLKADGPLITVNLGSVA